MDATRWRPQEPEARKPARQNKSTESLVYLLDLFYIWVFIFMDDVVRPHPFLSFIQSHDLWKKKKISKMTEMKVCVKDTIKIIFTLDEGKKGSEKKM